MAQAAAIARLERPVNKILLLLALTSIATLAHAAPHWPYDEKADAAVDVQHAIATAQADHKKVLLVFGANWCEDCRALDKAMQGSSQHLIDDEFEVVKIDIGNFDKNLALANRFGNPIAKGIPSIVVVGTASEVLYATKDGELANARHMTEQGIYAFLKQKIANRS
jgi:thioredoxin 1